MSSDKPPEKLYWLKCDGQCFPSNGSLTSETVLATYIREDLLQIGAINEAITQMQVEYHEKIDRLNDELRLAKLDRREYITCEQEVEAQRRREMFENVALVKIKDGFGYSRFEVAQMAGWILSDADKFARGEE